MGHLACSLYVLLLLRDLRQSKTKVLKQLFAIKMGWTEDPSLMNATETDHVESGDGGDNDGMGYSSELETWAFN